MAQSAHTSEIEMRMRGRVILGLAMAATLVGTGCSDTSAPLAPLEAGPQQSSNALLGDVLGLVTRLLVPPVRRTTPLADDITWSFTAGPLGATSYNPGVGLTIVIPPGALSSTKTITVTSLEGSPVAYKFEPHGLQFDRKVSLAQDLRGTTAGGLLGLSVLSGAYFATDRLQLTGGLANVTELL